MLIQGLLIGELKYQFTSAATVYAVDVSSFATTLFFTVSHKVASAISVSLFKALSATQLLIGGVVDVVTLVDRFSGMELASPTVASDGDDFFLSADFEFFERDFAFARPDFEARPQSCCSLLDAPSPAATPVTGLGFFGGGGDSAIWPIMWFLNGGYWIRSYGYDANGLNDGLLEAELELADGKEASSGVVAVRYEETVCEDI